MSEFKIRDAIARRYWTQAAIAELAQAYKDQGYKVSLDAELGGTKADLVARKDNSTLIVEVKSGPWSEEQRRASNQLREFAAQNPGSSFKLLWVSPPREVEVVIEGLEHLLREIWMERVGLTDVADLASNVAFEAILDYTVESIVLKPALVRVRGNGSAEFELQYGSGEDAFESSDAFPFEFHLELNAELEVTDVLEWKVDVSSFYE